MDKLGDIFSCKFSGTPFVNLGHDVGNSQSEMLWDILQDNLQQEVVVEVKLIALSREASEFSDDFVKN